MCHIWSGPSWIVDPSLITYIHVYVLIYICVKFILDWLWMSGMHVLDG